MVPTPYDEQAIGQRLRQARKAAGFSQTEAARRTGLDRSTVIRAERGCEAMQLPTIVALMRAYRLQAQWLLMGSGPMHWPREAA